MTIDFYPEQEEALEFLEQANIRALFMETGTGKTPVTLKKLEKEHANGLRKFLVVCPNALTYNWVNEARKWGSFLKVARYEGNGRKARVESIRGDWDVLCVNYESIRTLVPEFLAVGVSIIVFDEMHRVKSRQAAQTKACKAIAAGTKIRLGLTGTPVGVSPLDLWSEFDVLSAGTGKHILGYGSFKSFEAQVADCSPHPFIRFAKLYKFPDHKLAELKRRLAPHAFEMTKEFLKLPERTSQIIYCDMEDEQAKVYEDMKNDSVVLLEQFESGDNPDSAISSSSIVLTQQTRLQQITAGFIKMDDGQIQELPSAKLTVLKTMLPEVTYGTNKTCVFSRFTHDINAVISLCSKLGLPYRYVDGRNSKDGAFIAEEFQNNPEIKVFIGNLACVSEGLNLFAANSVFYFTNSYNRIHRSQSQDRVYRKGQTKNVTYYDLVCKGTIDKAVLKNLKDKDELSFKTVSGLKAALLEESLDDDFFEIPF